MPPCNLFSNDPRKTRSQTWINSFLKLYPFFDCCSSPSSTFDFSAFSVVWTRRLSRLFSSTKSFRRRSDDSLSSARSDERILLCMFSISSTLRRILSMFWTTSASNDSRNASLSVSMLMWSGCSDIFEPFFCCRRRKERRSWKKEAIEQKVTQHENEKPF